MDESAFDIDQINLAAMVRRFPPHRQGPVIHDSVHDGGHEQAHDQGHHDGADVDYLETTPRADHARQAWDEGGHY